MKTSRLLWFCNGGMALVALGPTLFPAFLTTFAEIFDIAEAERLGRLAAILFAGFIVGIAASGPLADRFGPRPFAVGGAALSAIGLLVASAAWSYATLAVSAFIIGTGAGVLDMVMSPIVSMVAKNDRARALNRLHAFYAIGAVAWLAIATITISIDLGWRIAFALASIAPAAIGIGFSVSSMPVRLHDGEERSRSRTLIWKPGFWIAMAAIGLTGATEEGMNQWLPAYAELDLGFSKASASLGLAGFSMLLGIGRLSIAHLPQRWSIHSIIAVASFASGACYLGASQLTSSPALAACIATGLACSVLWPTVLAATAERFPNGGATMFGILTLVGNAGCLVSPWMIGIGAEATSLRTAIAMAAIAPIAIFLPAIIIRYKEKN